MYKTCTMKKIVSMILVMACVLSVVTITASAYSNGSYTVNTSAGVNVRTGAGSGYSRVGAASQNVTFTVSQTNGSWGYTSSIRCTNGYRSGWVCLDYCRYNGSGGGNARSNYCTITYNANGGSGAPSPQTVEKGKNFYVSKTIPYRSGYSFLGWSGSRNASYATISPGHEVYSNADYTIYAVWASGSVRTGYTTSALSSGYCYYISPACAPNSVLDVSDWGKSSDTNIQIWEKGYTRNQRWQAFYYGSGYYYFVDYNSKLVLDVHGGLALNEKNVSTWPLIQSDAQLFRLISAGNGYYYIQSKLNPAYYLDIYRGLSSNGTNVQIYQANYSSNQKFKFTPVFDVNAAVRYAQTYTDNSGAMNGKYNSTYNIYKQQNPYKYIGYDCANFISQCLYAGGLNATSNWYPVYRGQDYRKVSGGTTWVSASDLFTYLRKQGFNYARVNSRLSNIHKGDIVFIDFDNDGYADHSTICTGFSGGTPVYCAHSNWRKNYCYSTSMWTGGAAYVVYMSGYGT